MEYAQELLTKTNVCELLTYTSEGNFVFDVRDEVVGWNLACGSWEPEETAWMKAVVRPGDVMIDVGANLGWYTVAMARQVGESGRVLAFEPDSRNFSLLQRNVDANQLLHRCSLHHLALLDREQVCSIERSESNFGDHRVQFADASGRGDNAFHEEAREVAGAFAITLDEAIDRGQLIDRRIRLLKVDAQGSEIRIFRGAQKTLVNVEYLLSEYWPYALNRAGGSADEFADCLVEHFAEFCRFTEAPLTFKPIAELRDDLRQFAHDFDNHDAQEMYVFRKIIDADELPPTTDRAEDAFQAQSGDGHHSPVASHAINTVATSTKTRDELLVRFRDWLSEGFPGDRGMRESMPIWSAALAILLRRRGTIIVQTGCPRRVSRNDGEGGMIILAKFAKALKKASLSVVNNSIEAVSLAKERVYSASCSERVEFFLADSVEFLARYGSAIDFLYLNSLHASREEPMCPQGQTLQLREIGAAYDKLTNGAVVLLEGNDLAGGGTGKLAKQFLEDRGWFCLIDLEQSLWIRSIDP